MRKLLLALLLLGILSSTGYAQNTLTLTTYYPAPFGSFDRIRLIPVDGTTIDCTGMDGMIILDSNDGQLKVCMGDTLSGSLAAWIHDSGTDEVYLYDDDADSNLVKSSVGIGTQTPADRLDLADSDGNIRFYDGNGEDPHVLGPNGLGNDGIILRALTDPADGEPIFKVESSDQAERLRVEHNGAVKMNNVLEVDGAGGSYFSGNLGLGGETAPVNALDVAGGAVIGSGYTATGTDAVAPAEGLLVEGDVAIGKTAPDANMKLDVNGNIQVGVPGAVSPGQDDYIYFQSGGYIKDDGNMLIFGHN